MALSNVLILGQSGASPTQYALAIAAVLSAAGAWIGVAIQWANGTRQIAAAKAALSAQLQASADLASKQIESTARNTSRQAKASVIATSRQRWIDALRDDLATFLAREESYRVARVNSRTLAAGEIEEHNRELLMLMRRIELRLSPKDSLHQSLLGALMEVLKERELSTESSAKVMQLAHEIFALEAEIIEAEAGGQEPLRT